MSGSMRHLSDRRVRLSAHLLVRRSVPLVANAVRRVGAARGAGGEAEAAASLVADAEPADADDS